MFKVLIKSIYKRLIIFLYKFKSTAQGIFCGRRSSASFYLYALLLRSCFLSAALPSSHLLWLWSPRLTSPLDKFTLHRGRIWGSFGGEKLNSEEKKILGQDF